MTAHPTKPQRCPRGSFFRGALTSFILFLGLCAGTTARGEWVVSLYTGVTSTENNDLRLNQSGGTDLVFDDVSYEGRDFESPLYYGARLSYFRSEESHWGFGLEFFHAKVYLNTEDIVRVTGSRSGAPVNASERVGNTISSFNMSHGLNFLTADAMYRWFPGERGKNFLGRFQPYVGVGIGAVIPHVESNVGGVPFEEYQVHGPGVQAFTGVNFDLTRRWSLLACPRRFCSTNFKPTAATPGSIML